MITITFVTNGNKTVTAEENSNLLRVSLRQQGGIPFKCGGGICGTCRCHIDAGLENTDKVKNKERKHLTDADLAAGFRMACQTFVTGDVSVSWKVVEKGAPARPAAQAPPVPGGDRRRPLGRADRRTHDRTASRRRSHRRCRLLKPRRARRHDPGKTMTDTHLNHVAGEWRPAAGGASFEDRNPADERDLIGAFPDSGPDDVAAAVEAVSSRLAGLGRRLPRGAGRRPFQGGRHHRPAGRRDRRRAHAGGGQDPHRGAERGAAHRRQFPPLCRRGAAAQRRDLCERGRADRLLAPPAGRRGRRHHAVELSAVDGGAEDRPGARRRQRRRLQALRGDAADGPAPGRGAARGRRAGEAAGAPPGARPVRRPGDHAAPRHRRRHLHRLLRGRPPDRQGGLDRHPGPARDGRQERDRGARRCRRGEGRGDHRARRLRPDRAGLHRHQPRAGGAAAL